MPDNSSGLHDLLQKVEGSLIPALEDHAESKEFRAERDGLDFLEVKNTLFLTYMIELTKTLSGEGNRKKLIEMKVALEKIRPLEKKMRYQIDKLLALDTQNFVTPGVQQNDPLSFRPNLDSMKEGEESGGLSSDDESDDENESEDGEDNDESSQDDEDDDLAAAKATLLMAREKQKKKEQRQETDATGSGEGIYRAPRLSSMPYPASGDGDEEAKNKRRRRRMRNTELVQTLRDQYGDAPEQDDIHGGSAYGKQREAARRLAEKEAAKTRFEEDHMIRLTATRKDKKERRRLMREESSNLAAMTDLGNLVRGVNDAFEPRKRRPEQPPPDEDAKKFGTRKFKAKNSFQEALIGGKPSSKKKKRRR